MLTVEDGTGLPNANSYVSVEYANAHFLLRGNEAWAALTTTAKEIALVKATEYIDVRFANRLQSPPLEADQALQFPKRYFITPSFVNVAGVPDSWKKAVCEYALISTQQELFTAPQTGAKEVKSKETTVGPITTKVEYADSPSVGSFTSYPKADQLVAHLFQTPSRVVK